MKSHYHYIHAVLVGDLGAYQLFHARQAYGDLAYAIQQKIDGHCVVSIEAQDQACNFLRKHGTRITRNYAASLYRDQHSKRL